MILNYIMNDSTLPIIILGIIIIILFFLVLYKNIKKIKISCGKQTKKYNYHCMIISRREYVNKENEKFYYIKFLINEEEREFLVPKDKYTYLKEGISGQLILLYDKVFLDFIIK